MAVGKAVVVVVAVAVAAALAAALVAAFVFMRPAPPLDEQLVAWLPAPDAVDAHCRPVKMSPALVGAGIDAVNADIDYHLHARNEIVSWEMLVAPRGERLLYAAAISRVDDDAIWFHVDRSGDTSPGRRDRAAAAPEEPLFFRDKEACARAVTSK